MKKYILAVMSVLILVIAPIALFKVIGFHYDLNQIDTQAIEARAETLWSSYPNPVFGSEMHHDYRDELIKILESMGYDVNLQKFEQLTSVEEGPSSLKIGDKIINLIPARGGRSTGLDFTGEMIVHNLSNSYEAEDVKGRVVISTGFGELLDAQIEGLYDSGCLGIIVANGYYLNGFTEHDYSALDGKLMPVAYLGEEDREYLLNLTKESSVEARQVSLGTSYTGVEFFDAGLIEGHIIINKKIQIVEGYNIIASLQEGQKDYVFASHYDGGHLSGKEGLYFNTTSVASIIEIAKRIASDQEHLDKNVAFVLFDGGMINQSGVDAYKKHFNDETSYIFLDRLGLNEHMLISSNNGSKFLKETLMQYDINYNLNQGGVGALDNIRENSPGAEIIKLEKNAVLITADYTNNQLEYYIGDKAFERESFKYVIDTLDKFIKVEIFRDVYPDYMRFNEWLFISLMIGILSMMSVIKHLKFHERIKRFYYSLPYTLFKGGINAILIVLLTTFIILSVTILPSYLSIFQGRLNYSFYILWLKILTTVRTLFESGLGMTSTGVPYKEIILNQSMTTFKLIGIALLLSTCLGLLMGMLSHYVKKNPNKEQSMMVILGLSIPETVLIMIFLLSLDNIMAIPWIESHMETTDFRTFIMPLVVLSLVPTIYVARTVFMTLVEEAKKKYIISLKAKGVKKDRLYRHHLSKVACHKVLSQSPILLAISISTMIICERMFAITGLFTTFIDAMFSRDYLLCIGIVFALMIFYYFITVGAKMLSNIIMPRSGGSYEVE